MTDQERAEQLAWELESEPSVAACIDRITDALAAARASGEAAGRERAETRVRALLNYLIVRKPAWKTPRGTLLAERWEIAVLMEMDHGNVRTMAHHSELHDSREAAEARLWELAHCDRENLALIDRHGEPLGLAPTAGDGAEGGEG